MKQPKQKEIEVYFFKPRDNFDTVVKMRLGRRELSFKFAPTPILTLKLLRLALRQGEIALEDDIRTRNAKKENRKKR